MANNAKQNQFQDPKNPKGVKRNLDAGFLRSDICLLRKESQGLPSAAGENRKKSFGSPDNKPDEAKIFLDVKQINLL